MKIIKPLGNNLLVSQLPQKERSDAGILLPQQYQDDAMRWRVLAIGPKVADIAAGDHLLCPMYHGNKLALDDGTERMIIDAKDVIAVWRYE